MIFDGRLRTIFQTYSFEDRSYETQNRKFKSVLSILYVLYLDISL